MWLAGKIEEIRRKPEHVRLRYVWLMVAVSMVFVIVIWLFSLKSKKEEPSPNNFSGDILNQFSEQKKSLQDTTKELENAFHQQEMNSSQIQN